MGGYSGDCVGQGFVEDFFVHLLGLVDLEVV